MPAGRRTRFLCAAIMAGCVVVSTPTVQGVLAASGAALDPPPLERPIEVRGKLVSGANFAGKVTEWNAEGIKGSFGERAWSDLVSADLRRIYLQVMDKKNAAQWLRLGELLGASKGGTAFADDAFSQAKRLGSSAEDLAASRTRAVAGSVAREERERMERERRLQDATIGADATATPWPVLTDADRAAALTKMRQEAEAAMEVSGIKCEPVETEKFLLYGDLPRAEMQRWGRELDSMYARVADILAVPKGINLFWGKAVILAFEKQDTFRLAEAAIFNQKAPATLRGICHMRGPQTFISIYLGNNELEFASTLVHETTHAIVHRYATPLRLPEWANEGFAEWVARTCVPRSNVDAIRRPQGLAFFRQGGDANKIMALSGTAGTWPGDNAIGYSVGYLLVDLMIADRPQKFGAWVKSVKGGTPWQKALVEDFGVDSAKLAQSAAQWYRTNDGAPRH